MRCPRPWSFITMSLALVLVAAGCASTTKTFFLDREANFAAVQRVAILPLDNLTNDNGAPEKVRQILTIELLRARAFDLVDTAETRQALFEAGVERAGDMNTDQMKLVGESLEVQGLIFGSVREVAVDRTSGVNAPTVSLHFRMADALTGETIWSTVVSRHGAGAGARLFGLGGKDSNEAIRELVKKALNTLIS